MNRILRMCLLGVITLFGCLTAFAQEDKSSLLQNADMERGLKGWAIEGEQVLGKNTKDVNAYAGRIGFFGMNMGVHEAWNSNPENPLGNSEIKQRLRGLPSGTYVFGAYVGAAKQTRGQVASNRNSIVGVSLFANDSVIPVATDNPDMGYYKWGHSSKFNVAVTLADTGKLKGYLDVGLRVKSTNANYVVWDNATLYYFGSKSEAEALDAMAEIDMANAVLANDTVKNLHMHTDSLANLTAAFKKANDVTTTAATLWDDSEELFWAIALARRSANDYKNLAKSIEDAEEIANITTWPSIDPNDSADPVDVLKATIKEAEAAYAGQKANRAEITTLRVKLSWYAADVKCDSLLIAEKALEDFIAAAKLVENQKDGYTTAQIESLEAYQAGLKVLMSAYKADSEAEFEDRTLNPNTLLPYIQGAYDAIEEVKSHPFDGVIVWSKLLNRSATALDSRHPIEGTVKEGDLFVYTSDLFEFSAPVKVVRLTVNKSAYDEKFFSLSALEFYDKDGELIALTASDISSNADHNSLPGNGKDGDGIPALVDGKENTYFHSDWGEKVDEAHYLEVVLPDAGYDAFYFKMVSRGALYNYQFPGEVIVATPNLQPGLYTLGKQVEAAKALNAYSLPEPGYYVANFSDLAEAIVEAEAMIEGDYTDDARAAKAEELKAKITAVEDKLKEKDGDAIHMPDASKVYHIISALPGFYEQQRVEKAMTVRGNSALFWENASADSLQQQFKFEPVVENGEHKIESIEIGLENGETRIEALYYYYLKFVDGAKERYVSVNRVTLSTQVTVRLSDKPRNAVRLVSLGAGQWYLIADGAAEANQLHANRHASGIGKDGNIVAYNGYPNSASAWYIRELPELPYTVTVSSGAEYESALIRFGAANTLTLKADKACAFADLALYDPYGYEIELDTVLVSGETATVITAQHIVACTFAFSNAEGVTQVEFNAEAIDHTPVIAPLEAAYEKALTFNPSVGDSIGLYADITVFEEALAAAEALLERGTDDKKEVEAAVKALEDAQKALKPNLPEVGKFYFIYNGLDAFEEKKGYDMTLYADTEISGLRWGAENYYNSSRYWEFVPATHSEVRAAAAKFNVENYNSSPNTSLFFVRNAANGMYIAEGNTPMVSDKAEAMPYAINILAGTQIALDGLGLSSKRIHANNHASGYGTGSDIVYYASGAGSASAWRIVETEPLFSLLYYVVVSAEGNGRVEGGGFQEPGSEVVLTAIPSEGYHFEQWSDGSKANPYVFTLSQYTVLKATFLPNKYQIMFVVDGEMVISDSLAYGSEIALPKLPIKEGYTFGWGEAPWSMPANDVTVYGTYVVNKYLITFKIGNEVIASEFLEYGTTIVAPDAPEKEGYTFDGWGKIAETVPACDATYVGSYTTNKYKVYYYVGEELVHTAEVTFGEAIPEYIYEPTKEGDVFEGWVGDAYDTMPAHDVTYTANITNGMEQWTIDNGQLTIYDLTGRKVTDTENLKGGIYIVNGKKTVIK